MTLKLAWVPNGRVAVQFDPPKTRTASGLFIPDSARSIRKDEIATVLLVGGPAPRGGVMMAAPPQVVVGARVWVHPQFGRQWLPADIDEGEIRCYDFAEIDGGVEIE